MRRRFGRRQAGGALAVWWRLRIGSILKFLALAGTLALFSATCGVGPAGECLGGGRADVVECRAERP